MNVRRLTKKERDERVLDLYYNQNKTYREIAKLERICPRDIGLIVNKESKDIESKQFLSKAAQAYEMFQKNKSPMEVAISLDLREQEVTQLFKESCNLKQTGELNRIYLETGGNLSPFLMLYKLAKDEGMKAEHVVWLLEVANKGLTEVGQRYHNLKSGVDSLKAEEQLLIERIEDYRSQVTALGNTFDNLCRSCEREGKKLSDLRAKRMKEEALVKHFENSNGGYLKITKTVEERVRATLSNRRKLLELAALSIVESIREHPEKYISLVGCDTSSNYSIPDFNPYYIMCGLQWPDQQAQSKAYSTDDYVAMLSEDADKIFENLVKMLEDKIISDYTFSVSGSLPFLPASDGGSPTN